VWKHQEKIAKGARVTQQIFFGDVREFQIMPFRGDLHPHVVTQRSAVALMPARTLMERGRGLYLHINPGSTFNLEVTPEHIASLLRDETIHNGTRAPDVPPEGAYIQLKKLNISLPALEAALMTIFREVHEVRCAFLVEAERTRQGECVRTLMMIAESAPSKWLEKAVSTVFWDVYDNALPVDICFDEGDKDFVNTLKRIGAQPFYERTAVRRLN
jgi:hypothetical protein